jgi:hypothetical protein
MIFVCCVWLALVFGLKQASSPLGDNVVQYVGSSTFGSCRLLYMIPKSSDCCSCCAGEDDGGVLAKLVAKLAAKLKVCQPRAYRAASTSMCSNAACCYQAIKPQSGLFAASRL